MKTKIDNQSGFTLIELLIATTVFSIILLTATATLIQIGRMYYKGVISSKTQGVSRTVIDDISRNLQFSSKTPTGPVQLSDEDENPKIFAYCIGDDRYTFVKNIKQNADADANDPSQIKHVLWKDEAPANCSETTNTPNLKSETPSVNGTELLEQNMRLADFRVEAVDPSTPGLYNISITIIYGDNDLINFTNNDTSKPVNCKGSDVGGQWCAFSTLSTQVYKRAVE